MYNTKIEHVRVLSFRIKKSDSSQFTLIVIQLAERTFLYTKSLNTTYAKKIDVSTSDK